MTVARGGLRGLSGMRAMGAILTGVEKYCTKWALVALCCNLVGWDGWMDGSYPLSCYQSTCGGKKTGRVIKLRLGINEDINKKQKVFNHQLPVPTWGQYSHFLRYFKAEFRGR